MNDITVLHMPYSYFPDSIGGTEVYVAGLAAALLPLGVRSAVAAPGDVEGFYLHDNVPVFGFAHQRCAGFDGAYGAPDPKAMEFFRALIAWLRPQIVHLHGRTPAVSDRLVDAAHEAGAKVVFTYHAPGDSCPRGTLMWMGRAPCDGRLDRNRCTACVLEQNGLPVPLCEALAQMPQTVGDFMRWVGLAGRARTVLRLSSQIGVAQCFAEVARNADRIVAPCAWVFEALRRNGLSEPKLVLCRQGVGRPAGAPNSRRGGPSRDRSAGVLRLGFFGRLHPTKGPDIVVEALRQIPDASVQFEIYGVSQPGYPAYAEKLERTAAEDPRISLRSALLAAEVRAAMQSCDIVAVPSRWLETGPLVVLEAFAAGSPVIGARLGGIAELVTDGVDGVLVPPDDPAAWASTIATLAAAPEHIARLRAGIGSPRTIDEVAREMAQLYQALLADTAGGNRP